MPPPRGLVQRVDQDLHRSGLLPRKARLLVAVSGGADSIALLRLLTDINGSRHWQWRLVVGHVDHGMRGRASARDAQFVKKFAAALRVPFISRKLRLGPNTSEEKARDARLGALVSMAKARDCRGIVLGHHADDQAETVLMKLFRGCGLDGLAGISDRAWWNGTFLYRPLLDLRRDDLRAYLASLKQPWREDATNASADYTRNRLRLEVLPAIERIWPRAVDAVVRMSRVAQQARQPLRDLAQVLWQTGAKVSANRVEFDRETLRTWEALVAEAIRHAVDHLGGTREIADWERISEAVRIIGAGHGGKQVELGDGIVLSVGGGRVLIARQKAAARGAKRPRAGGRGAQR